MRRLFTLGLCSIIAISVHAQQNSLQISPTSIHQRLEHTLSEGERQVSLCDLIVNEMYRVSVNTYTGETIGVSLDELTLNTSSTISFKAKKECEELFFRFKKKGEKEKHLTLSISRLGDNQIPENQDKILASITTTQDGNVGSLI